MTRSRGVRFGAHVLAIAIVFGLASAAGATATAIAAPLPAAPTTFATAFTLGLIDATTSLSTVYVGPTGTLWAYGVRPTLGGAFLYRSIDGGSTWEVSSDLRASLKDRVLAIWQSTNASIVYLGTMTFSGPGLWVSKDAGASFSAVPEVAGGSPNPVSAFQEVDGVVYAGGSPTPTWGGLSLYRLDTSGKYLGGEILTAAGCPQVVGALAGIGHDLILALTPAATACGDAGIYRRDPAGTLALLRRTPVGTRIATSDGQLVAAQVSPNLSASGVYAGSESTLGTALLATTGVAFESVAGVRGSLFVAAAQSGARGSRDQGLWTSTDGTTWVQASAAAPTLAVAYGAGVFLAGTTSGARCSQDGRAWKLCNGAPPPLSAPEVVYLYVSGLGTCGRTCDSNSGPGGFRRLDGDLRVWSQLNGIRPVSEFYSYNDRGPDWVPLATANPLSDSALLLARQIGDVAVRHPTAQIVLIGHSQGGLIALLAAGLLTSDLRQRVSNVFTLDSPIQGADFSGLVRVVLPFTIGCNNACADRVAKGLAPGSDPVLHATAAAMAQLVPTFTIASTSDILVSSDRATVEGVPSDVFDAGAFPDRHGNVLSDVRTSSDIADVLFGRGRHGLPRTLLASGSVSGAPGTQTAMSLPSSSAGTIAATLETGTAAPNPATVVLATYSRDPVGASPGIAQTYLDLAVVGADRAAKLRTRIYYPSTTAAQQGGPTLQYFNGSSWVLVRGSGGLAPTLSTGINLDGVVSGGRFDVTFDVTSTPSILDLTGTVLAVVVPAPSPEPDVPAVVPAPPPPIVLTPDSTSAPPSGAASGVDAQPGALQPGTVALPPVGAYHAQWLTQSVYPTVRPGAVADWYVGYRNTGSAPWLRGVLGASAQLGTALPLDTERFAQLGLDPGGWLVPNRVSMQLADVVPPGKVGWFKMQLKAPGAAGIYRVWFRPVIDGTVWMEDYGAYVDLEVKDGV